MCGVIVCFLFFLIPLDLVCQENRAIPQSERRALDTIYAQAGGEHWTNRNGWTGARGTECDWYGVTCESDSGSQSSNHIVRLELNENKLRGVIPDTAADLSHLHSVWLWGNELVRIPPQWQEREDLGELDLRTWDNPLVNRITDISFESAQGDLLCAHWMLKLNEKGHTVYAAIRCRNRTQNDRATYCEVKESSSGYILFPRLARFIEKSAFYDLKRSYTVNQTHAGTQIVRLTRNGIQRTVDNYGYMEPLNLFGIELAIAGVLPSVSWERTTRHAEEYCHDMFERGNNTVHTGVAYVVELSPGVEVGETKYIVQPDTMPISREIATDHQGELLVIESFVKTTAPTILKQVSLSAITLGGRQSMEHRAHENGRYSREIFFPIADPTSFVHIVYHNLSKERAAKADQIIETIDEKTWK